MTATTGSAPPAGFQHHASVYGSDEEFLAMAVPFVAEGLARGEPVLATTTAANLDLLSSALGPQADRVDYAESAHFGRRPPLRVTAFGRYWRRTAAAAGSGHVRILAEPVWAGRSAREVTEWRRMESGLNEVLAPTNIWMICPYDERAVDADIVAEARRTHPGCVRGREILPSPEYVEPARYARSCDADPLPAPPAHAGTLSVTHDLAALRRFVQVQASACGLVGDRATMLVAAVNEVASYLVEHGGGPVTLSVWRGARSVVCDLREPSGCVSDPFVGFRLPTLDVTAGDRFWLARQVCEYLEIRSGHPGSTVRLHVPGERVTTPAGG